MIVALILILAPALPLLGVQMVAYHAAALLFAVPLLARRRILLRPADLMLVSFIICYAISLGWASGLGFTGQRVMGSLYNWTFWVMGLLILLTLGNPLGHEHGRKILRAGAWVFVAACSFGVLAWLLWSMGLHTVELNAPVTIGGGVESTLIGTSNRIRLVQPDWLFSRNMPRTAGFVNYPTAYGGVLILSGMMAMLARRLGYWRPRKWLGFIIPAALVSLLLSGSRGTVLALGAAFCVSVLLRAGTKRVFWRLAIGGLVAFVGISLIAADFGTANTNDSVRSGSTRTRRALYGRSIELWKTSPVVGIGVKPQTRGGFPIGSHSTYVGVLQRTGLLGLVSFVGFMAALARELYGRYRRPRSRAHRDLARMGLLALAFTSVWMVGDDIDAPQLMAFMFFILVGLSRLEWSIEARGVVNHQASRQRHPVGSREAQPVQPRAALSPGTV